MSKEIKKKKGLPQLSQPSGCPTASRPLTSEAWILTCVRCINILKLHPRMFCFSLRRRLVQNIILILRDFHNTICHQSSEGRVVFVHLSKPAPPSPDLTNMSHLTLIWCGARLKETVPQNYSAVSTGPHTKWMLIFSTIFQPQLAVFYPNTLNLK